MRPRSPKSPTKTPAVHYLRVGPLPVHVGVAVDQQSYARELKRLGMVAPALHAYVSRGAAATTTLLDNDEDTPILIIGLNFEKIIHLDQLVGVIAHELAHVWQYVLDIIGEAKASEELEAYYLQYWMQQIITIVYPKSISIKVHPPSNPRRRR